MQTLEMECFETIDDGDEWTKAKGIAEKKKHQQELREPNDNASRNLIVAELMVSRGNRDENG